MIPDLFIEFGPRSILSIVGIITLVSGVWYIDRTWDEKGSKAYEKAKANSSDPKNVIIPQKDLDAAFPFPIAFLVGWVLFAISYLFPTNGGFTMELGIPNLIAVGFSLLLGIVASVPMGDAVMFRKAKKKTKLSMLFVLSWIGLTIASGFSTGNGTPSFVLGSLGAVSIILSMKILWKNRKMGDSWEQEGRPNPNPIVYNAGGPLFVFGWFLFWVGMASTNQGIQASDLENGIPIYYNIRTAMAFFAGVGMVPIVMMIDYAHDEGGEYVGYGTSGEHYTRLFESPIPFLIMWTLFGVSSFFAIDNTFTTPDLRKWLLLANGIIQALVAGHLIQTALYVGNMPRKNKFSVVFVILFLLLALNISFDGGLAMYFALPGALLVIAGQKTSFNDRKRGNYWMIHNMEVNPNPIVYTVGQPLFMFGWILLALAMSFPMS